MKNGTIEHDKYLKKIGLWRMAR